MCGERYALGVVAAVVIGLFAIGPLSGCGGAGRSPAVIRVGDTSIGKQSVDHWTSIITRGTLVADVSGVTDPAQQSPRQQALSFLIASAWLNGEAARAGLRPSRGELARLVKEQMDSPPNGPAGFAATLAETGQTMADVEQEARARWAEGALAHRLVATADRDGRAQVTGREVANTYRTHMAQYHLRERRYYDLHEQIPTRAQAVALARRLGSGKRFSEKANKEKPFRPTSFKDLPGQAIVYRAVFAAKKTGVIVGPLPLQGQWCLFVLRRIAPATLQPLSEVRGSIERRLLGVARRNASARFVEAYRQRWIAMTDCRPGYVVQKCRQYAGARAPEPAPFAGS